MGAMNRRLAFGRTAVTLASLALTLVLAPSEAAAQLQYCTHDAVDSAPSVGCDTALFWDGFEDCQKSNQWTFQNNGSGSDWWYFTDKDHSGHNALYFGDPWRSTLRYSNYSDARALSPQLQLPSGNVELTFWIWSKLENGYDFLDVDVIVAGGSAQNVWSTTGRQDSWQEVTIDLSAWAGQAIQIRLRATTDYSVTKTGVWIDDLAIVADGACCTEASECDDGIACSVDACIGGVCQFDTSPCSGGGPSGCQTTEPNFVILLDRSGSMDGGSGGGDSKWNVTIQALEAALGTYGTQLNVGLKLFSTPGYSSCGVNGSMDVPLGATDSEIIQELYNTYADGATPMGRGLYKVSQIYSDTANYDENAPRYVMLITDGEETCDWDPVYEVEQLAAMGVETFVVGFGDGVDEDVLNAMAVEGGHALAGGEHFYNANNAGDLEAAFASILSQATAEVCDGIDNDCDGETDEEVGTLTCNHATCGEGVRECVNGVWGACQLPTSNEVCDGADNNCNMVVDDPWVDATGPVLGQVCTSGTGLCERGGVFVCPADLVSEAVCSAAPGPAQVEGCNLLDDDCDGYTDNDVTGAPAELKTECYIGQGTPGVGICRAGERTCVDGSWHACTGHVAAQTEVCNNLDDDCDGQTDELPQCCQADADCGGGCAACVNWECQVGGGARPHIISLIEHSHAMREATDTSAPGGRRGVVVSGLDQVLTTYADDAEFALKMYHSQPAGSACDVHANFELNFGQEHLTGGLLAAWWPSGFEAPITAGLDQTRNLVAGLTAVPTGTSAVVMLTTGLTGCGADPEEVTEKLAELNAAGVHVAIVGFDSSRASDFEAWGVAGGFGMLTDVSYWPANDAADIVEAYTAVIGSMLPEMCNGLDDDCDGSTDESVDPRSCYAFCTGSLVPGTRACAGGDYGVCEPIVTTEACDGLDNDCDGTVDEPFLAGPNALGVSCSEGAGECRRTGKYVCASDGNGTACDAVAGAGTTETCDGIDNDCDGVTDDAWIDGTYPSRLGDACVVGFGGCQASGYFVCPASGFGAPVCNAQTPNPGTETCDGLDNDCDGLTDNDPAAPGQPLTLTCYAAAAQTVGVGACRAGVRTCTAGGFGGCVGEVVPSVEVCDGVDNDCDGYTDEDASDPNQTMGRSCYDGPSGTAGTGECVAGAQACNGSAGWGACVGQVLPESETCDSKDSDCNGVTDDHWVSGAYGHTLGEPCTAGTGACAVLGTYVCSQSGLGAPECSADGGQASEEVCDGVDNDCDGLTDENQVNQVLSRTCTPSPNGPHGLGWCQAGAQHCVGAQWSSCAGAVAAAPEVCDGADNDCDGGTDEDDVDGLPLTAPCSAGAGAELAQGVCQSGHRTCAGGSYGACENQVLPSAEICDGLDNDCDGLSDEGVDGDALEESCYGGEEQHAGVGACSYGVRSCSGGVWGQCQGDVMPGVESCNGVDDDCDGLDDLEELNAPNDGDEGPCESNAMCQFGTCYCVHASSSGWKCILE